MEKDDAAEPQGEVAQSSLKENRSKWTSLFAFTSRTHIPLLCINFLLSIASGAIVPILAILLGKIFDAFTLYGAGQTDGTELVSQVSRYGIALTGLGCASGLLNAVFYSSWLLFGELQAKDVRRRLFESLLYKEMEWYELQGIAMETLTTRMQSHIRDFQLGISQPLGFFVQYTATSLTALGIAFFYSWSLTLVILASLPASAVLLAWMSAKVHPALDTQVIELTAATRIVTCAISAIETVTCYNGQNHEVWQYARVIRKAARSYRIQACANALQIGLVRFITLAMFVQGFWYGSHLVATSSKNAGEILTAFWATLMATQTLEQILPQYLVLSRGRAAGDSLKCAIYHIQCGRKVVNMSGANRPQSCDGDVEFRNVTFSYPTRPDQYALDSVNLFFPAGETTFVVGRSGSGKSSIGNLLTQFYRPRIGDILIDGNSIQTLDMGWLRNNVALIQQETALFSETIFTNIAFGSIHKNMPCSEAVNEPVRMASLRQTINHLPSGLNTLVGPRGSLLSGGQKQRVAIARARLQDAPILVLDEATSALDQQTGEYVMREIRKWRHGKTTIIITHDLSQVGIDDYVYVLEGGQIKQEGLRHRLEDLDGSGSASLNGFVEDPNNVLTVRSATEDEQRLTAKRSIPIETQRVRSSIHQHLDSPSKQPLLEYASPTSCTPQELVSPLTHRFSLTSPGLSWSQMWKTYPVTTAETAKCAIKQSESSYVGTVTDGLSRTSQDEKLSMTHDEICVPEHIDLEISSVQARDQHVDAAGNKPQTPKDILSIKSILSTVWPTLTWTTRMMLIVGFLSAAIHAAATPLFSWVFARLLATFFLDDKQARSHESLKWSLAVLAVAICDGIASYMMHILLEYCGQAWIDALRIEAFRRILEQPRSWFDIDAHQPERLAECLDRNAEEMRNLLGRFAGFIFVAIIMVVIAIIWSLILSWKLTLVGLSCAPILYGLTHAFEHISGIWETKTNDSNAEVTAISMETFNNIRTVRILTLEGYFHKKHVKATKEAFQIGLKRSVYSGIFYGLSDSGIIFTTAMIFFYGARLASTEVGQTTNILTVFTMLLFSFANANAILAFIPQISSSRATAAKLLQLTRLTSPASDEQSANLRISSLDTISLVSTSFAYPLRPTISVLSTTSIELDPRSTTAITGPSGGGKSTIAALLLGLYKPTSGSIRINDIPLTALHLPTLRSMIAYVPQSPTIFPTTIAANIAYALPESHRLSTPQHDLTNAIHLAATLAGLHDFISSLPSSYTTLVGPGGTNLSGGQAHRLAIARAIMRHPRFLILDEPTSALDSYTAQYIIALVKRCRDYGVGVLVITHNWALMHACRRRIDLSGSPA